MILYACHVSCCVLYSSSGTAMLQWLCGDTWSRRWNLQIVWCVLQHTKTKVNCVQLCKPQTKPAHLNWYKCCILSWCRLILTFYDRPYRTEFESDGTPDLNKDVYLQDIHCVSSLCKAYFRELPNPLLTYQLYDKFAVSMYIFCYYCSWLSSFPIKKKQHVQNRNLDQSYPYIRRHTTKC